MILHRSHVHGEVWAAVPETDISGGGVYRVIINDVDVLLQQEITCYTATLKLLSVYLQYENGTPAGVQFRVASQEDRLTCIAMEYRPRTSHIHVLISCMSAPSAPSPVIGLRGRSRFFSLVFESH